MCILGLLIQPRGSAVKFVCLHNRDEFFERPACAPAPAATLLFGRDLRAGGTWYGYSREKGLLVALTNAGRRDKTPPGFLSRGTLLIDILNGRQPAFRDLDAACAGHACANCCDEPPTCAAMPDGVPASPTSLDVMAPSPAFVPLDLSGPFAGFNLVVAALRPPALSSTAAATAAATATVAGVGSSGKGEYPKVWFVTNRPLRAAIPASLSAAHPGLAEEAGLVHLPPHFAVAHRVCPGAHAVSNSTWNDARWAKVDWLRRQLTLLQRELDPPPVPAAAAAAAAGADSARSELDAPCCRDRRADGSPAAAAADSRAASGNRSHGGQAAGSAAVDAAEPAAALGGAAASTVREAASAEAEDDTKVYSLEDDLAVFTPLMARLVSLMSHTGSMGSAAVMPDLTWSAIPAHLERHLQDHVFINPLPGTEYGTRATSATVQVRDTVFFAYRSHAGVEGVEGVVGPPDGSDAAAAVAAASAAASATAAAADPSGSSVAPAAALVSSTSAAAAVRPAAELADTPPAQLQAAAAAMAETEAVAADARSSSRASGAGRRDFGHLTLEFNGQPWLVCWDRPAAS